MHDPTRPCLSVPYEHHASGLQTCTLPPMHLCPIWLKLAAWTRKHVLTEANSAESQPPMLKFLVAALTQNTVLLKIFTTVVTSSLAEQFAETSFKRTFLRSNFRPSRANSSYIARSSCSTTWLFSSQSCFGQLRAGIVDNTAPRPICFGASSLSMTTKDLIRCWFTHRKGIAFLCLLAAWLGQQSSARAAKVRQKEWLQAFCIGSSRV